MIYILFSQKGPIIPYIPYHIFTPMKRVNVTKISVKFMAKSPNHS